MGFITVAQIVGHNRIKVAMLVPMIMKDLAHQLALVRNYLKDD